MAEFAINTVVHVGGYGDGGKPWLTGVAAVCNICGGWADCIVTSGEGVSDMSDISLTQVARRVDVHVYTCREHYQETMNAVCDEFGWAANTYEPDELAAKVSDAARKLDLDGDQW